MTGVQTCAYPGSTWNARDLVERAGLLTDREARPARYGYWPRGGATCRAGEMIAWLGGALLDVNGWPHFDTPAATAAVARYADLIALAPPDAVIGSEDASIIWGAYPPFVEQGQVAMWLDDYSSAREATRDDAAVRMAAMPSGAVAPAPRVERALYIAAGTAHPEACWRWLWYVGGQPEAARLLPARWHVARSEAWRARVGGGIADAWLTTLERSESADWGPYSDGVTLGWVDDAFGEVLQGADPAEALGRAQIKAETYAACIDSAPGQEVEWTDCVRVAEGGD